jgi:hypothetical protein
LFWILQRSPTITPGPMATFWPITQSTPIRAPAATWLNRQTRVPVPSIAPGSTSADG